MSAGTTDGGAAPELLFTENETNAASVFGSPNEGLYVKDAFHAFVVHNRTDAVSTDRGTKAAARYVMDVPAGGNCTVRLRLRTEDDGDIDPFQDFDRTFEERHREADAFYARTIPQHLSAEERRVSRQAYAGLLWSQQFYHYVIPDWITGDAKAPLPPRYWRCLCSTKSRSGNCRTSGSGRCGFSNRKDLVKRITDLEVSGAKPSRRLLLSLPGRTRLKRSLRYLLDEGEFLSPYGVRSLSRIYKDRTEYHVPYVPGDSDSPDFGGSSNWRGPVWFPINFLLIAALREYDRFYGATLQVECPAGSGRRLTRDWQIPDPLSRGVVNRIGNRRCDPYQADLAQSLGSQRVHDIVVFVHEDHVEVANVGMDRHVTLAQTVIHEAPEPLVDHALLFKRHPDAPHQATEHLGRRSDREILERGDRSR